MLSTRPTHRRIRIALGSLGLVVASVAASSAQVTSGRSFVVLDSALADTLRARISRSGETPEQIRARLRAHNFPEDVLDPYMTGGRITRVAAPVPTANAVAPAPMPNATPLAVIVTQPDTGEGPKKVANDTYFEFQVEEQVRQVPGVGAIQYPAEMKAAKQEGEVLAQFVVDTTGLMIPGTFKVLKSTNGAFTAAVRDALPTLRWVPAQVGGHKVKQLVQQPFQFSPKSDSPTAGTPVRPNP